MRLAYCSSFVLFVCSAVNMFLFYAFADCVKKDELALRESFDVAVAC